MRRVGALEVDAGTARSRDKMTLESQAPYLERLHEAFSPEMPAKWRSSQIYAVRRLPARRFS